MLLGVDGGRRRRRRRAQVVGGETVGNTEAVGWLLYTTYLVPFEVVSVVLLVAMIGAIIFGRRTRP
jgi:NADH-quinone oxidoreductase subunit J